MTFWFRINFLYIRVRFTIQFNLIVHFLEIYIFSKKIFFRDLYNNVIIYIYIHTYIPFVKFGKKKKNLQYSLNWLQFPYPHSTGLLIKYFYNIIVRQCSFQIILQEVEISCWTSMLGWKLV